MLFGNLFARSRTIIGVAALTAAALLTCSMVVSAEPVTRRLWTGDAQYAIGQEAKDIPSVAVWIPSEPRTDAAIVVCPGGGYAHLNGMPQEGVAIAEWLNSIGVAAFVLDYRHRGKGYGHPATRADVQRAIRLVRASAAEYKIDPHKIGVLGFSAGGHLASTAATHFDAGDINAADPIDRVSSRPDFAVLCYAAITFSDDYEYASRGSRRNLLGETPDPALVEEYSNERRVTSETPQTFIFSTDGDNSVPPEHSVLFYMAMRKHKVPVEMHIFRMGRHGFGLGRDIPGTNMWPELCAIWLRNIDMLPKEADK